MNGTVSRKYVLVLAVVALLVLTIGARLRPQKKAPEAPSPSELATLQRRVQRETLRDHAGFFAGRANEYSRHITLLEGERNGVTWGRPGQILTVGLGAAPLEFVSSPTPMPPPPFEAPMRDGRWVLVVGRSADNTLFWISALNSGTRRFRCQGIDAQELVLNTPLDHAPLGAALFDLEGMLAGLVTACEDGPHAMAASSFPPVLSATQSAAWRMAADYGIAAQNTAEGQLVTEVRREGAAARFGLRAGDTVLASTNDLSHWLANPNAPLTVLRNSRKISIPPSAFGPALRGISERTGEFVVEVESPAFQAGLRSGDRILQVEGAPTPRAADVRRALEAAKDKPAQIIYERGASQYAAVVQP